MEKSKKLVSASSTKSKVEHHAPAPHHEKQVQVKDFYYKDFKKIADRVPVTQQEWSDLLHISERTLQRYAKSNGIFSFAVTDRILQIDKVIKKGTAVFGSEESFMSWLKSGPVALEGKLSLQSLSSIEGIQQVFFELGRIEQGLFA
jgi:putative toxin-antitoxin system antitoxin component (TIGR02293 family)